MSCTLSFAEDGDGAHFFEDWTTKEVVSAIKQKEDNCEGAAPWLELCGATLPAEVAQ